VRVLETDTEVFVDAPRPFTKKQKRFLEATGKIVVKADADFIRGRSQVG